MMKVEFTFTSGRIRVFNTLSDRVDIVERMGDEDIPFISMMSGEFVNKKHVESYRILEESEVE